MYRKEKQGKENRVRAISLRVTLLAACAFLVLSSFSLWLASDNSSAFRAILKHLIREELVSENPKTYPNVVDAIYVLGGSQSSLEFKFKTTAELYHNGVSRKIMILSRPGKTEYSSLLGRNLTNDEWAICKLEDLGIPQESVELVSIAKGFFGTLTEAGSISRVIEKRGYKSLVLISSPYHTHRVRISFEKFLNDHDVTLYVHGSDEKDLQGELVKEFIKLKIYEYLLVS